MTGLKRGAAALLFTVAVIGHGSLAFAKTTLRTEQVQATTGFSYPGTTAIVDTTNREIRLPPGSTVGAGIIDGRPSGYDVVTINGANVETYSFNGLQMIKNNSLSLTPTTSPLAVAGRMNNTDVVVMNQTQAARYSFNGSGEVENPFLSVAGLAAPVQVATNPGETRTAVLDGTTIRSYSYDGSGMVQNPSLAITSGLTNPVAFALRPQTYDVAVVDGAAVKYYSFNGTSLAENPFMRVSGLTDPVAVQVDKSGTVFVQESGGITAYGFDGAQMRVNSYLSVPAAVGAVGMTLLGEQNSLAVRYPTEIRFYQFNGSQMVENTSLRISGLAEISGLGGGYASSAQALSTVMPVTAAVDALVLTGYETKPAGTNIQYQVSGDGGTTWSSARLSKGVPILGGNMAGARWRAILSTTDPTKTPLLKPDIVLTQVYRPGVPTPVAVNPTDADGLVRTATPRLQWTFNDLDTPQGDMQMAFQVLIYDAVSGTLVHDSGKISADAAADPPPADVVGSVPALSAPDFRGFSWFYDVPSGALWGGYRFQWTVRVWDTYDLMSDWTPLDLFEVMALTNLRITDVVVAPGDPMPALPSTALPLAVRAGSMFDYAVDSLGIVEWVSVTFSDSGARTTTASLPVNSVVNTWSGDYFTDPTLQDGTVVIATFTGGRSDGRITSLTSPIVVIGGTVHEDFVVILGDGSPTN